MQDSKNIGILIALGCLVMFVLVLVIIMFVVIYQRKMLLKEAKIQLMEQEKQIALFKASVEVEEQQKEKIARNLHDEINPLLSVLKFNISKHQIDIQKNRFDVGSFKADSDILNKAIEGIRTTCMDLVPSFLLQYGLTKSLEEYISQLERIGEVRAEFISTVDEVEVNQFSKQEQLNIYRVCLEVLNNLFKHGSYTELTLSMEKESDSLNIIFEHNGKGVTNEEMEVYTKNSKGLGLKSLKARVLILNASLNYSVNQNYSTIKLNIPFRYEQKN